MVKIICYAGKAYYMESFFDRGTACHQQSLGYSADTDDDDLIKGNGTDVMIPKYINGQQYFSMVFRNCCSTNPITIEVDYAPVTIALGCGIKFYRVHDELAFKIASFSV